MAASHTSLALGVALFLCAAHWSQGDVFSTAVTDVQGNGILSCRPGAKFPRDCGNVCQCSPDGTKAECSVTPCPTDTAAFDKATRQVYRDWSKISSEGIGPVFTCKPYSVRKVNAVNGKCFCAKSGISEICSTRRGSPWGGYN